MRDIIGINIVKNTISGTTVVPHKLRLFFMVMVRIWVRVKVLGNSDHCVLKFNSVLRY